jgi:hypothetical protein
MIDLQQKIARHTIGRVCHKKMTEKMSLKARLHYVDNCYKLVRFKVQKNIFLLEKTLA